MKEKKILFLFSFIVVIKFKFVIDSLTLNFMLFLYVIFNVSSFILDQPLNVFVFMITNFILEHVIQWDPTLCMMDI